MVLAPPGRNRCEGKGYFNGPGRYCFFLLFKYDKFRDVDLDVRRFAMGITDCTPNDWFPDSCFLDSYSSHIV
ncbi:hypothetical protein LENED_011402 [Lentinula edodes]|uniref:Uncharacterized protein n=1 Tax=Lentinula edodes TaxID=5353 RepID=A0A1Q3EPX8_LENED|nr:hypothetical protein LENED_011402 [Lentinula edodes]